jgi:hypothetical protein
MHEYPQSFGQDLQSKFTSDNYFHIECDLFSLFAGAGCRLGVLGRMRAAGGGRSEAGEVDGSFLGQARLGLHKDKWIQGYG